MLLRTSDVFAVMDQDQWHQISLTSLIFAVICGVISLFWGFVAPYWGGIDVMDDPVFMITRCEYSALTWIFLWLMLVSGICGRFER